MKKILCVAAAIVLAAADFGTVRSEAGHVAISQVQLAGDGGSDDEFIELYNPTGQCVSLASWSLQYLSSTGNFSSIKIKTLPDVFLPPQAYFLAANGQYNGQAAGDSTSTNFSLSAAAAGATIFLSNGAQKLASGGDPSVVDKFGYGNSPNNSPLGPAAQIPSTTLVSGFGADWAFVRVGYADDNSLDFAAQLSSPKNLAGSPGGTDCGLLNQNNSVPPPAGQGPAVSYADTVKISEILANPAGADDGKEAVELFNSGTSTVDLAGWFLSDSHGIGNAYQLPTSTAISAEGFLAIVIPAGFFSLNNNGDTANLYYPDLSLADSVSYSDNAPEGKGYQIVSGAWLWASATLGSPNAAPPPPTPTPSSGGGGGTSAGSYSPTDYNFLGGAGAGGVRLSEFLPNPGGGKPWVELQNTGTATASLAGWKLDGAGAGDGLLSAGAYALSNSAAIGPKSFLAINVPVNKLILRGDGGSLRLFRPDNSLAESVVYPAPSAGQSYSLGEAGNWIYGLPTPGAANAADLPLPEISISELLPNPAGDDVEFIELRNLSTTTPVELKGFKLLIGSREKILDAQVLATSSYLTLYEDDLPVKLRAAGQIVRLFDNFGRGLSAAGYDKAAKGRAWAWAGGSYAWTELPTPGADNQMVLSAATVEPAILPAALVAAKSVAVKKMSTGQTAAAAPKQLEQKVALLESQLAELESRLARNSAPAAASSAAPPPAAAYPDWASSLALIFSALALLILTVKYFLPAKE